MSLQQFRGGWSFHPARYRAAADCGTDGFHSRPSPGFVGPQRLVDVTGFAEQLGQGDSVFDSHRGALR